MFEDEKSNNFKKLIESVSDDLFLIKLELKLTRIDELLDKNDDAFDKCEDNLRTPFQRMFFCKRWLKNHIFWTGEGKDKINKVIDQLYNNFRVSEGIGRNELFRFVDRTIAERSRLIEASRKMFLAKEITASEYRKDAMAGFEQEKMGLSRIEALFRLNRIQWLCELLNQMESYFKQHHKLDEWKYEMPLDWGRQDARTALDF